MTDPLVSMLRRDEQKAMTDRCKIYTETEPDFDPADPDNTAPTQTVIYPESGSDGPCRLTPIPTGERMVESAGDMVVLKGYNVGLPWDAPDIPEGAFVEPTVTSDPELAGKRLRVMDVMFSTWQTRRRLVARLQHEGD